MKVNNNKDSVDLSAASRSKRGEKAGAAHGKKGAGEAAGASSALALDNPANVDISGDAKALSSASQIAKSDNADEAKIARVKAMINKGTYKPDFGKVADKMVNEDLLQELS